MDFRCVIFTIPIAVQVLSLRPAALGFNLILYITHYWLLALIWRCLLLLTPVVGSD